MADSTLISVRVKTDLAERGCCEPRNFSMLENKRREFFIKMVFLNEVAQEFNRICGFLVRPVNFGRTTP